MNEINKITFVCNSEKGSSGGAKIIYNYSEIINYLNINNISSQVLHIKKKRSEKFKNSIKKRLGLNDNFEGYKFNQMEALKNFKYNWFKNRVTLKKNFDFNQKKDFIILPEIYAHFAEELCLSKKIKYAIFVQNGYAIKSTNDYSALNKAYLNASFLLSYSNNISNCITTIFPNLKNKILKINCSVNINRIKNNKKNIITFMNRKLPAHSDYILFMLKNNLSTNWKIKVIDNLNENEVFKLLSISKIFLSFSNLEGLGLPPIEAALSKNIVIGYHGEGGKDYWKYPLFNLVKNGDMIDFVKKITEITNNYSFTLKHEKQRKILEHKYSKKNEEISLKKILNKISKL